MPTATTDYVEDEVAELDDRIDDLEAEAGPILVEVAEDVTAAILTTTSGILLASSASGAKPIATTSKHAGQKVNIYLRARSGGSYTLAVEGGTLTLDAAGEHATVMRTAEDDAWIVVALSGATIV